MNLEVCEIGMPRTGTRSLARAMMLLDYSVQHGTSRLEPKLREDLTRRILYGDCNLRIYQQCSFVGNISSIHWQVLAEERPEVKFILTVRNEDEWWESCRRRWKRSFRVESLRYLQGDYSPERVFPLLYKIHHFGCVDVREQNWRDGFRRHHRDVFNYFQCSDRLLVLDVSANSSEENWKQLCSWLDKPIPNKRFPCRGTSHNSIQHANNFTPTPYGEPHVNRDHYSSSDGE